MSLLALYCNDCGGSIMFKEGQPTPECPFCGSKNQVEKPLDRTVLPPNFTLRFVQSRQDADKAFRTFAQSSFWYPKDIRNAKLELQPIFLPAWLWSGQVETHYNGLRKAPTISGYYPQAGEDTHYFSQILIPASKAIGTNELNQIAPFPVDSPEPFNSEVLEHPFELGELTERIALTQAQSVMETTHRAWIYQQTNLRQLHTSSIFQNLEGEPALLPIYVGVYRRKDSIYRILVNGLTNEIHGEAPFDWLKLFTILSVVIAIVFIASFFIT